MKIVTDKGRISIINVTIRNETPWEVRNGLHTVSFVIFNVNPQLLELNNKAYELQEHIEEIRFGEKITLHYIDNGKIKEISGIVLRITISV